LQTATKTVKYFNSTLRSKQGDKSSQGPQPKLRHARNANTTLEGGQPALLN